MSRVLEKLDPGWRRVGILGGAFDPPHYGHLALARGGLDALALDAVVFIPASRPPHKTATTAAFARRLAMVSAAVSPHPGFFVSDIESHRSGPSYSVETLRLLREMNGWEVSLAFFIGFDAFLDLPLWKEFAAIPELAELVVARRCGLDFSPTEAMAAVFPAYEKKDEGLWSGANAGMVRFLDLDIPDISSTMIRQRIRNGDDVSGMIPAPVADIIAAHNLY